ncbi:FtsX-like permease family protein [Fulvivirga sp. M361]|nr:FtsX-like permease family protein [Fulvivirga sp. M361]
MYQHNFKLTYRNFLKHRSQFLINLTGLSTGLACVLLIYLWVTDEKQVDKFHQNHTRLYQVMSNHTDASGITTWKGVPGLLLEEIQSTIPEVEYAAATTDAHEYTLSVDDSYFKAHGKFASENFLDVFTYPLIQGSKSVLSDKSGIVISESLAQRLFRTSDVVGKDMKWHFWGKEKLVQVTGVMKDVPEGASEKFDFLMSWDYFHDDLIEYKNWYNYYGRVMVVLNSEADENAVETKIDQILKENQEGGRVDLFLANYSDRYLNSKYENGIQAGGQIEYVRLFSIVAIFILFIACINFINLSTAKASHRTKEIGVKKSMGASKKSLIAQFFTESVLLSLIAMLSALFLVWLLLPQFNLITQKSLTLSFNGPFIITTISLIVIVGIFAGSYPALFLSSFDPIEILKGKLVRKPGEIHGRKVLVIVQFTLSIILIVAVGVVYKQMDFVKNKNLGYDKDNLVYFEREGRLIEDSESLLNELRDAPGISHAALSGFMIGGGNSTGGVSWEGKTPEDQLQFWEIKSGHGLVEMMDMEIVKGRSFSSEFGSDSTSVLFNETAIDAMGLEDPIGKTIQHYTGEKKIVGVVKDFNLISLHTAVEPMIFLYNPEDTHFIMAKLNQGSEAATLEHMERLYKKFNAGYVFKPEFIDDDYQNLYTSEERVGLLSSYFSGLAVLISCLGLFGLAAFTVERRTKEIGIRKVLGAGSLKIIYLLSHDFTKMVLVAIVIALPISFFIAREWLKSFAFKIDLAWWLFAGAGMVALLIAWLTVGIQTIKAAGANPVKCLKDE